MNRTTRQRTSTVALLCLTGLLLMGCGDIAPQGPAPDWSREWRQGALLLGLQVWEPEGTTPDGRQYVVTAAQNGKRVKVGPLDYDGTFIRQHVMDLDGDGSDELLLQERSFGTGAYLTIVIHKWDGDTFSKIDVSAWDVTPPGYMGHDHMILVAGTLIRSYPIYRDGDANVHPTGGTNTLRYVVKAGQLLPVD